MRLLVTGASGFLGSALLQEASSNPRFEVIGLLRRKIDRPLGGVVYHDVGDLASPMRLRGLLSGVDVIVHTAARVHVREGNGKDALARFRAVNVQGSLDLAAQAAEAGVRRFVFVSTVKVNGESTEPGQPFQADDAPAPVDAYAISKWEAEQALRDVAEGTGMELTIVRPPLVYGSGVQANFLRLLRWVDRGIPLPFGRLDNKRSLVAVRNLVDFLLVCCTHPGAASQVFLVSDDEDLSTAELVRQLASALRKHPRLVPVPEGLLRLALGMTGRQGLAQRLCGSLQVEITESKQILDWSPPWKVKQSIQETVSGYLR